MTQRWQPQAVACAERSPLWALAAMVATTRRSGLVLRPRELLAALPLELIAEIAGAVARVGDGVGLAVLSSLCRTWRSALGNMEELWREAALKRFPRLERMINLSVGGVASFRTLYAAQHRAELSEIRAFDGNRIIKRLSDFILTVELTVDGVATGRWTGKADTAANLRLEGPRNTIRLTRVGTDASCVWDDLADGEVRMYIYVTECNNILRTARLPTLGPLVVNEDEEAHDLSEHFLEFVEEIPRLLPSLSRPNTLGVTVKGDGYVALNLYDNFHGDEASTKICADYLDRFVKEYGHGPPA